LGPARCYSHRTGVDFRPHQSLLTAGCSDSYRHSSLPRCRFLAAPVTMSPRMRRTTHVRCAVGLIPSQHGFVKMKGSFDSSSLASAPSLPLCSSLHHTDEKSSLLLPKATDHRIARAPPSSLSEATLKPQLQVSPKRRPSFAAIDVEHRWRQPSTVVLWANHRRRVAHLSSELLTNLANPASDPFPSASPSSAAGRAPPPWKHPVR
jgi:hypothetical protein